MYVAYGLLLGGFIGPLEINKRLNSKILPIPYYFVDVRKTGPSGVSTFVNKMSIFRNAKAKIDNQTAGGIDK